MPPGLYGDCHGVSGRDESLPLVIVGSGLDRSEKLCGRRTRPGGVKTPPYIALRYSAATSSISCSTLSSFVAQLVHTRTAVWCLSGLPMWVMA